MKIIAAAVIGGLLSLQAMAECPNGFDQNIRKLHSKESVNLCDLFNKSKAMLVVNTASHCGFTKQFSGLEALHKQYADKGLVVVGIPSNDFYQEEKSEEGTASVCYQNYGVSFVMTEPARVKGAEASPVFGYVNAKTEAPSWNFNKYLVLPTGEVEHFGSRIKPQNSDLESAIQKALNL
ncbi:MAG: glutathione peroxidase [Marinagarivorans sp.]|nr:glutathione peroxidase [Marinagarivorans sp.]